MKFGGSGIQDWLMQRLTAVIMLVFIAYWLVIGYAYGPMDYTAWRALFDGNCAKISTLIMLIAVAWHAWIGLWTITTDYIKPTLLRLLVQWAFVVSLAVYVIWGILILWG